MALILCIALDKKFEDLLNEYKDNMVIAVSPIYNARKIFKEIKNKYFINNRSVDQVVDELIIMIQNISMNK